MFKLKSTLIMTVILFCLTFTSISTALVSVGWGGILSTEWVLDLHPRDGNKAILSELTLISLYPKCPNGTALYLDVYLIFYDNKENPIFYGVVKRLSPRDITKIDLLSYLLLGTPGVPGKGTVAMLPLPSGISPDKANDPAPGFPLDGYLTQYLFNMDTYDIESISKTGFLGTAYYETNNPLCEFRGHADKWKPIENN